MAVKLTDLVNLSGQVETITLSDFRSRPGDIITQVQMGKTFTITKAGKKAAVLSPVEMNALELGAAARKAGIVR